MGLTTPQNLHPDQHLVGCMVGVQELLVECPHWLLSQGGCQQRQLLLRKASKLDP